MTQQTIDKLRGRLLSLTAQTAKQIVSMCREYDLSKSSSAAIAAQVQLTAVLASLEASGLNDADSRRATLLKLAAEIEDSRTPRSKA